MCKRACNSCFCCFLQMKYSGRIRWLWGDWAALLCKLDLATQTCLRKQTESCVQAVVSLRHAMLSCQAADLSTAHCLLSIQKIIVYIWQIPATAWTDHSAPCWQTVDATVVFHFKPKQNNSCSRTWPVEWEKLKEARFSVMDSYVINIKITVNVHFQCWLCVDYFLD